jgi:hypothetical protein
MFSLSLSFVTYDTLITKLKVCIFNRNSCVKFTLHNNDLASLLSYIKFVTWVSCLVLVNDLHSA